MLHQTRQVVVVGLVFFVTLTLTSVASMERGRRDKDLKWLQNTVVVVDPGHGGDDPGAVVRGTKEKELVLRISQVLKQVLEEAGGRVVLTRATDEDLGGPIREELGRRVAVVREHQPHVFVSIHANKDGCYCWGAQTFFQRRGMPAGQELALAIQQRLRQLTPTTRVALPADYFVLRTSPVPAAMVEVGFLTNDKEHSRLLSADYQRTLARAVALGIADFLRSQVPPAKAGGSIGQ